MNQLMSLFDWFAFFFRKSQPVFFKGADTRGRSGGGNLGRGVSNPQNIPRVKILA
jgi:hypothetical protein